MLTYKIHLIRHGLTEANFEQRYIGSTDLPLCAAGIAQLRKLREDNLYPQTALLFTSPLQRAVESCELLFPGQPFEPLDKLRELDFGDFENRTIGELEKDPAFVRWIAAPGEAAPGGESGVQALTRATEALAAIFARMMEQRITAAAVMTHGGIIAGLLASLGLPQREAVRWQCAPGEGFTALLTPQMWMRDSKIEVYAKIPTPLDDEEETPSVEWRQLGE